MRSAIKEKFTLQEPSFYRQHYHHVLCGLMLVIVLLLLAVALVLYQLYERPLPTFSAYEAGGKKMQLTPFTEPNLLPDTILRWACKGAIAAYTFNFGHYEQQIQAVRPYFTDTGWADYLSSVRKLLETIVQKQLFVNSVVAGTPVISNQGELPGKGYTWRVQIPFLVTYQNGPITLGNFLVILTIVRVPTAINPQGIGIDQFIMVPR